MNERTIACLALGVLFACGGSPPPSADPTPPTASSTPVALAAPPPPPSLSPPPVASPSPVPPPPASPPPPPSAGKKSHARPAFESACQNDQDCEAVMPGNSSADACCSGCEWKAANKTSLARFREDCKANPPDTCPPIGCVTPRVHAACKTGRCVTVIDR